MNCHRVVNLISAYVDGELTGAEMLEIRRHLSECSECMEEYESIRMTKLVVTRLRNVTPSRDLAACIVQKLDEVSIPPYQRLLTRMFNYTAQKLSPVAAAMMVSGLALVFLAGGGQDRLVVEKHNVVATAPLSLKIENASVLPTVPEIPMMYSNSRPLVVANHKNDVTFRFADLSTQ